MDPFYFYRYTWSRCPDNKQLLNRKLAHFKQLWRGKAIQSTVSWHTTLTVYVHTHRWSVTLPSINHSSMKHYCRKQKQHKNTLSSHMATSATLKAKNNLHGFVPVTRRADKKKQNSCRVPLGEFLGRPHLCKLLPENERMPLKMMLGRLFFLLKWSLHFNVQGIFLLFPTCCEWFRGVFGELGSLKLYSVISGFS